MHPVYTNPGTDEPYTLTCAQCGIQFRTARPRQATCGRKCHYQRKHFAAWVHNAAREAEQRAYDSTLRAMRLRIIAACLPARFAGAVKGGA